MPCENDWDAMYLQYEKMIHNLAHRMRRKYSSLPLEHDELVSEGWEAVLRKSGNYDPEKANPSTWVYTCAYYGMQNYCRSKFQRHGHEPVSVIMEEGREPEHRGAKHWLNSLLEELSEEAELVVQTILEAPEELQDVISPTSPVRSLRAVESYMVDAVGWSFGRFQRVEREIVQTLS